MKILISAVLALVLVGCSSENKENTQDAATQSLTQSVKEVKSEAEQEAQDAVDAIVEQAQDAQEEVVEEVEEIEEAAAAKVEEIQEAVAVPEIDSAKMFQVCAGCHGADASKPALGKSQVIKGWDANKIADALHGYKNGTYGGVMKGIMVGQVSKLSEDEIEALAEHISKL